MPVDIRDEGEYELFETTNQNEILVLNGEKWYSIVEGQAGEIIVLTDADHEKNHTIQKGRFFFVDFKDDPTFRDVPHLFMGVDDRYEEIILPHGFPTEDDKQKKIIRTGNMLSKDEVEGYLEHPAPGGPGAERMERPAGGSLSNVVHHLKGVALPADRGELIRYARKKDAPQAVIEQLEVMSDGQYTTMADITRAIGEGMEPLPIEEYDDLSASEIVERLDALDESALQRIREYEASTLHRKTILRQIDQKLEIAHDHLPIDHYKRLSVEEITGRLDELDEDELRTLKKYEEEHDRRKTVLEAVSRRLAG